jgi:hypothetical protein
LRRCKLVVGGSAKALKILADESLANASVCKIVNLSIHGFGSGKKALGATKSILSASKTIMMTRSTTGLVQHFG